MSFTALKGWNYHTETFDTLSDYLNPLKNLNHNLTRHCTVPQLFTGLSKVFSRDFIAEQLKIYCGDGLDNLIHALAHDERIPIAYLIGMSFDFREIYDEEEDEYRSDHDNGMIHVNCLYDGNRGYSWSIRTIDYSYDDESITDIVNKVASIISSPDFVNPNAWTSLDHEYNISALDVPINCTLVHTIWSYHFARTQYRQYFGFEGVLTSADRVVNISTLTQEIRDGHTIEISPGEHNICRWVVPTQSGDRRMLHRLQSYSTKASQLISGVLRSANELSDNLYGIELEVSSNLSIANIVDAPEKTYCFVKQDSSISGSQRNAYEIVSIPATIKVHILSWAQIFSKVGYQHFDVTKNTTNGMHIHVDMNAFNNNGGSPDQLHLKHFCWFLINPVNLKFQVEMSERGTAESMEKYSKFPKFYHTTLPSCFKNSLDYTAHPFRGIVHFKQDRDTGRFVTLEVRMFKGIPSLGNIVKNLEYVDSVFDFTRKTCFQSNTLSNYLTYLDSTPKNKYTTLKEFLNRIGQQEIKDSASLSQLLWGQDDPQKMLGILLKNKVDVTQSNLPILNSLVPGVKFGLNKQGKVVVIESNRSRLYDLDISLQQRFTRFKGKKQNVSHPNT
jgi:hypothetical protein